MAQDLSITVIRTVEELIDFFADGDAVTGDDKKRRLAEKLGTTKANIDVWLHRQRIPPKYYLSHAKLIRSQDAEPDPALWGQVGSDTSEATATDWTQQVA